MKKNTLLLLLSWGLCLPLIAQPPTQLQKVVFTTGGTFLGAGNLVEVSCYDPISDTLIVIDSVLGDFSNTVQIQGALAYVHIGRSAGNPAGEDLVYVYNLKTGLRVDSLKNVSGLQRLKIHEDRLFLNRGYGAVNNFVQIYDRMQLAAGPVFVDTIVAVFTNDIVVLGDSAYVSYPAGDSGRIAIYDLSLTTPAYVKTVTFDTLVGGLDELYTDGALIYGLAERVDYPPPFFEETALSAGVLIYDPRADTSQIVALPRARDGIGLRGGNLWANFSDGPGSFDLTGDSLVNDPLFQADYTAMRQDSLSGDFYYQATDFFSAGNMIRTDAQGVAQDSFSTDISGSALALAYNHLPVAMADSFAFNMVATLLQTIPVVANDVEVDPDDSLTLVAVFGANPGLGQASVLGQQIAYQTQGVWGLDTLFYVISDGWNGGLDTGTLVIDLFEESGIDEIQLGGFSLYPNPADDRVTIQLDSPLSGVVELKVWTLTGQLLVQQHHVQLTQTSLVLENWPTGWYYLEISSSDRRMLQKLWKR